MSRPSCRQTVSLVLAAVLAAAGVHTSAVSELPTAARPGARVVLDAHNAYPYNGRFADRLERALAGGVPVAIEQDLVWRPAGNGLPARSIVSHGEPFDDREPSLRDHFFERIRPVVERALAEGDRTQWPLVTLNLDLKTNEPEHHRALWDLLGEYEAWLTTAVRTADPSTPAPLDVRPVLVLTGESDAQAKAFHDDVPVGARLRLFGAMPIRPRQVDEARRADEQRRFWQALPSAPLPKATNYRRWWNAPWAVVEAGGQREAGEWTADDDARLRTLVGRAHEAGLWVRLWTVNGHAPGDEKVLGWSTGYNVGSLAAARVRWRAAIAAGVDFFATDQYELFNEELPDDRPRLMAPRDVVIEGTLTPADRLTWIERPFDVPAGTARIDVETSYTDRDRGTAIEFGLYDPERFRGASRTSKTGFFVAATMATPSYHPGPLTPGTWRLLLGIPSIRDGVTSRYRVVVRLTPEGPGTPSPTSVPLERALGGPRWYQGDLHAHTMHSDGFSCADGRGNSGPCSAHVIATAAERRGLDFVAVTDHNTTSHHHGLVEVQARHPELLVLRGQEVTTFHGHANVFGTSEVVDFRIGHPGVTAAGVFAAARRQGALVSVNHPGRETGERCTGCGWDAPETDWSVIDAIEVVNGRNVSSPTAG
ncbi:MAG: CehA/McbA family metallohydrolase, partial [Vicinamibacteria bacterium]